MDGANVTVYVWLKCQLYAFLCINAGQILYIQLFLNGDSVIFWEKKIYFIIRGLKPFCQQPFPF